MPERPGTSEDGGRERPLTTRSGNSLRSNPWRFFNPDGQQFCWSGVTGMIALCKGGLDMAREMARPAPSCNRVDGTSKGAFR